MIIEQEQFEKWNKLRDQFELCWCSNPSFMLEPLPADLDALKEFAWKCWQFGWSSRDRQRGKGDKDERNKNTY